MLFLHKRGSLKIPRIRKASGPMSLFDPQEGKPSFGTEEAVAVRRPLLYVRDFLSSLYNVSDEDGYVSRTLRILLRSRRFVPSWRDPYTLAAGSRIPWGIMIHITHHSLHQVVHDQRSCRNHR